MKSKLLKITALVLAILMLTCTCASADTTEDSAPVVNITDLSQDDWAYDAILALCQKGIITIGEDGAVYPAERAKAEDVAKSILAIRKYDAAADIANAPSVTRAEMATIIVKSLNASTDNFDKASFDDVSADAEYAKYVECAKTLGIINGYGDGTFRPDAEISRKEAFAMINRMVKLLEVLEA